MRGLLAFLMLFSFLKIVEDGSGGGGEEPIDFVIDDEPTPAEKKTEEGGGKVAPADEPKKEVKEPKSAKPELDEETKKKLEKVDELAEFKREQDIRAAITSAVNTIREGHPDFDIEKVSSYLQELNEKDPSKAESLNNPAGWELIHIKHFAKDAEGVFDPGRGKADEPFEFEKVQKQALTGDKRAMAKLLANSK